MGIQHMFELLQEFATRSLDELTQENLETLRDVLLTFQLENDEQLQPQQSKILNKILDLIEKELNRQGFRPGALAQHLIENPAHVECTLATLSLQELLEVATHTGEIKSAELRQQFQNMLDRSMSELVEDDGLGN